MQAKKKRLTLLVFINALSLGAIALLIISALWVESIYEKYELDSIRLERSHISQVRSQLKNRVDTLVNLAQYRNKKIEQELKGDLKNRVYELNSLMMDIYTSNKGIKSDDEIKQLIRETVRGLRYNQGRGYYFIDTLQGDVILYPVYPKSEGTNLYNLQDDLGNYPLQDEIEVVKRHGHGFTEGYWKKPGDAVNRFKKIVYVKKFAPYDWYFGTGEYVDVVRQSVQEEMLHYVDQLRFGERNEEYAFIHDRKGVQIANGVYPELIGKENYDLTDANGVKIIQQQLALTAKAPFYGFFSHLWPKNTMSDPQGYYNSLTYVAAIPEWDWVVGSNIDMTALQAAIEKNQQELNDRLKSSILNILSLMFGLGLLGVLVAHFTTKRIRRGIEFFSDHMQKSSARMNLINHDDVTYQEFDDLAKVFNEKTEKINTLLHQDDLTGLFNRRFVDAKLQALLSVPVSDQQSLALILFDIDHFKRINDEYGHLVGDDALCEIAKCIQSQTRKQDFVGRFGGEEILVILPDISSDEALEVAERIREKVESLTIEGIDRVITVSGGISCRSGETPDKMITEADNKLYQAKKNGRNQIVI
ncbi:MAG: cache domain-containing protein [Marinomonas sp.]